MAAKFFGEFLLIQGLITQETLDQVIKIQQNCNLMLGELAISQGLLSEQEALEINLRQQIEDKRFGDIAEELGLLEHEQLEQLLHLQKARHKFFGDILVDLNVFTQQELNIYLKTHQQQKEQADHFLNHELNNHPLGEYLTAIIETTNRMFIRTLHEQSKFSQLITQTDDLDAAPITCQITLSGEQAISISMLTNSETAISIAHRFTMMPIEECDLEFSADAFGEFLNIIVGHMIDDTEINIPSKRSTTQLDVSIREVCSGAEQLLIAEVDTQIGDIFIIVSS